MILRPACRLPVKVRACAAFAAAALFVGGCATQPETTTKRPDFAAQSPVAEEVGFSEAWRLAETYVAEHPGCQILVGKGDSMLPLYRDRTVLLVQPMRMGELRSGMTVVFLSDRGRLVAHTLVSKTPRGWITQGMGNETTDRTLVHFQNYRGTVVKAYAPRERLAAANLPVGSATRAENVRTSFFATPIAD